MSRVGRRGGGCCARRLVNRQMRQMTGGFGGGFGGARNQKNSRSGPGGFFGMVSPHLGALSAPLQVFLAAFAWSWSWRRCWRRGCGPDGRARAVA